MFEEGNYVVYGCKGVHQIMSITTLDLPGISPDKKYYVLKSVSRPDGAVYAPVDAPKINMRLIMTRDEAMSFMNSVSDVKTIDIQNNKQREEMFKECIRSCDPDELLRVIKTVYLRKKEREASGKKLTQTDNHYLEEARGILYEELSICLGVDSEVIPEEIRSRIESDTAKSLDE